VGKPQLNPKVTKSVMIKAGLKPLEPYKSVHSKWKCIHIECGKIVYPTYISIKRGQGGCRDCGFKKGSAKRKNNEAYLIKVMNTAKLRPLEPYKNAHAEWKCRCLKCKKIVYRRFSDVHKSKSGCQYCSKRLVDEKDAVKIMLKKKLKPLVPYKNSKTKWKSKCLVSKKIVYPSYNAVENNRGGCKYCAGKVVSQAQAKRLFIKAKLMPLEPYKNSNAKWKSKCMVCGEIVYPTYGNIYMGHSGCVYCSDIGFKPQQPAILYLIHHDQMNAVKVGITNNKTIINRLNQFKRYGWNIHKKYYFDKGIDASKIEKEIIDWLKKDLKLRNYLTAEQMPITGGHSETFDADLIGLLDIQKKINQVIQGYKNNP
jgi:hypothetical protein